MQSLLLEGGPTLAAAFLAADLVDKLLVFVAPTLAGEGAAPVAAMPEPKRALPPVCRADRSTMCSSRPMSTSPETAPTAADRLVTVISRWLARHLDDERSAELDSAGRGALTAIRQSAVESSERELAAGRGGAELDMVARETLEALALGCSTLCGVFTGIVRERGRVVAAEANGGGMHLRVEAARPLQTRARRLGRGRGLLPDGRPPSRTASLEFDAVPETLARTNLGRLRDGRGGQPRARAARRRAARRALRPGPRRRRRPRPLGSSPRATARASGLDAPDRAARATASRRARSPSTASR